HVGRVPAVARRDGVSRSRLRADGPGPEHPDRGVPSRRRRVLGPRAQRAARAGHGARTGVRRDLRGPRLLVGPAAAVGRSARPPRACECRPAAPLRIAAATPTTRDVAARSGIPSRFWIYAAFAVLYGVCETVNGNWSQLDMTSELGASTTVAAFAL